MVAGFALGLYLAVYVFDDFCGWTRATIHEVAPLLTEAIGGLFRIFPEFWADAGNRENIVSGVFVIVSVVAGIIVTKVVGTATLAALATAAAVDGLVAGVEALAVYAVTSDADKAITTFYWGVGGGIVGNLWGAISLLRAGKKAGLIFKDLAGLPKQLDLETFATRARSILNDETQYQRLLDDLNLPENEALRLAMLQDADGGWLGRGRCCIPISHFGQVLICCNECLMI